MLPKASLLFCDILKYLKYKDPVEKFALDFICSVCCGSDRLRDPHPCKTQNALLEPEIINCFFSF